jgi:hypothetical protein
MKKNRARVAILNYVVQFTVAKYIGNYPVVSVDSSFTGGMLSEAQTPIGSLVILQAAPFSNWYLSWLREIIPGKGRSDEQYVLESIEDGQLCTWTNVSIWHLPLEISNLHPEWQWEDRQFKFWDQWLKLCRKHLAAAKPMTPKFDGDKVTLSFREYFENDVFFERTFDDYKMLKNNELLALIEDATHEKLMSRIKK